ncbi:ABC transporter substrate-binding protein [Thermogemmatispora onikobensis]|uniref:ABC transporter substrate-binding protein n=1 Tax=Thermogemmatispora onikobensis TaxID=732234 RepID=UPI00085334A3|nr:extracellular solute-binding protein [Thermogemmatispora onikobensis]
MQTTDDLDPKALLNRRQFVRLAGGATLGLAALLSGCGGESGGGSSGSGSLAIHFLSVQQADTGWPLVLQTITADYARSHPGVSFTVDYIAQTNLYQKVQLLAGQGALPLLYNSPPVDTLLQLQKSGQVLDLEAAFRQLGVLDQLVPAAITIIKQLFNNQLLALPFELNIEGFWYNKTIFARYGLQPPQTWDELVRLAAQLQQHGVQPFAASGIQGWPLTRLLGNYLFRKYGPEALLRVKNGQAKLTDPGYVEAAQAVATLGKEGYFGKGVAELDYDPAEDLFLQGKAAILYMGSWALRDFNNPARNKIGAEAIGYFPFPTVAGGSGTSDQAPMNAGQTTSVNQARYTSAAGDWLAYVARHYGDVALQKEGAVTGFVVHQQPASVPALTRLVLTLISQVKQPVLWFEALFSTKATTLSQQNAAPLVTGAMSPQTFMATIQQALDQG